MSSEAHKNQSSRSRSPAAAVMKFQALFFFLAFTCMYLCLAQGSYGNCCIGYATKVKPGAYKHFLDYRIQETDGDCNLSAVVFTFKGFRHGKPRTVCGNPKDPWVSDVKSILDQKLNKMKA
ncbi:hypothetical protein Q5P01_016044 [Channa striata]|uniref:Chemokine CC n=1 Tax=Channa striata TaxID=64152 RepID=V9NDI0_CHASR|nr:chemokine CC [Channa striata]KAK2835560.1 hypothetical protein Q5P01_016044 [Channa striata]